MTNLVIFVILAIFVIYVALMIYLVLSSNTNKKITILRRFAVINTRTDKIEFELTGYFECNKISDEQIVIEMIEPHKEYLICLNKDLMYIIEEIDRIIELENNELDKWKNNRIWNDRTKRSLMLNDRKRFYSKKMYRISKHW